MIDLLTQPIEVPFYIILSVAILVVADLLFTGWLVSVHSRATRDALDLVDEAIKELERRP